MSSQLSPSGFLFPESELRSLLNRADSRYDMHEAKLLAQHLVLRPLHLQDFHKGYLELLGQHTKVGTVSEARFIDHFRTMQAMKIVYYIVVIEHVSAHKIVATGTLEIEHKFIHSAALRGRLEDVVIDKETETENYRYGQRNLAAVILDVLTDLGKTLDCYKISLESEDRLIKFYGHFGYFVEKGQNYMAIRYRE